MSALSCLLGCAIVLVADLGPPAGILVLARRAPLAVVDASVDAADGTPPPEVAGSPAAHAAAAPDGAGRRITVNVDGFRSEDGALECSLFGSPDGFPMKHQTAVAKRRSAIGADLTAACVFTAPRPGDYAVGVMHDENGNGKFDQGLFGIPLEGYGFSNNHTHAFSAPTWDESRFRVDAEADVVLSVHLKY